MSTIEKVDTTGMNYGEVLDACPVHAEFSKKGIGYGKIAKRFLCKYQENCVNERCTRFHFGDVIYEPPNNVCNFFFINGRCSFYDNGNCKNMKSDSKLPWIHISENDYAEQMKEKEKYSQLEDISDIDDVSDEGYDSVEIVESSSDDEKEHHNKIQLDDYPSLPSKKTVSFEKKTPISSLVPKSVPNDTQCTTDLENGVIDECPHNGACLKSEEALIRSFYKNFNKDN